MPKTTLLGKLKSRGCIHDASHFDELEALLEREKITFYCGFDPTSDSLHVGSMLPLVIMRRLQEAGHTPIVVIGSATGMIGDPSFKSEERKLLDDATIKKNVAGIEAQIQLFLSAEGANRFQLVRNDEWLAGMRFVEFLRDVGKHFSVNAMIAKESVKARLENREQGISYTEFSYLLLQAYDYFHLNATRQCRLQVGGSDQWGNITAGLDLIRRKNQEGHPAAYGLTFPLLMTSSGTKFGKTERGTVWLDAKKTSPYHFYQYWVNTADADVMKYIMLFTPCDGDELKNLDEASSSKPEQREAQRYLAQHLTTMIHGADETRRAIEASKLLFGEKFDSVDSRTLLEVFQDVPSTDLPRSELGSSLPLLDLLVRCGVAASKAAARRSVEGGGIYLNNDRIDDVSSAVTPAMFVEGNVLVVRSGKRNYHLVKLSA